MASVIAAVLNGDPKRVEADTPAEALSELGLSGNYTCTINQEPALMDDDLQDEDFVSFALAVKAGTSGS